LGKKQTAVLSRVFVRGGKTERDTGEGQPYYSVNCWRVDKEKLKRIEQTPEAYKKPNQKRGNLKNFSFVRELCEKERKGGEKDDLLHVWTRQIQRAGSYPLERGKEREMGGGPEYLRKA